MKRLLVIVALLATPAFPQERPRAKQTTPKPIVAKHCGVKCWSRRILLAPGIVLRLVMDKHGRWNTEAR